MKTFLNIIGILALLAGGGALLGANSAIHQILGGIGILTAVCAFGFAAVLETWAEVRTATGNQRKLEREHWEKILAAANRAKPLPPLPGQELFYVAQGEEVNGPHTRAALCALLRKKAISAETPLLREGSEEWKTVAGFGLQ